MTSPQLASAKDGVMEYRYSRDALTHPFGTLIGDNLIEKRMGPRFSFRKNQLSHEYKTILRPN